MLLSMKWVSDMSRISIKFVIRNVSTSKCDLGGNWHSRLLANMKRIHVSYDTENHFILLRYSGF